VLVLNAAPLAAEPGSTNAGLVPPTQSATATALPVLALVL
jgi:hypothetical protein